MGNVGQLGIPQVAYQSLNQTAVEWLDVYHRLALEGIYLLGSLTSSGFTGHVLGRSYLSCFSSVGDCMQQGTSGITTVILGTARSIACVIVLMWLPSLWLGSLKTDLPFSRSIEFWDHLSHAKTYETLLAAYHCLTEIFTFNPSSLRCWLSMLSTR